MSILRSEIMGLMRGAFRRGQSFGSFERDMRAIYPTLYRRTTMLADWRSVNELERKEGAMRFVRKDYYPAETTIAAVEWDMKEEWMYKVKVKSRLEPGVPITERFVNIMSDVPMTPGMVEQAVVEKWTEWEDYTAETIEEMVTWSAVHRVAI